MIVISSDISIEIQKSPVVRTTIRLITISLLGPYDIGNLKFSQVYLKFFEIYTKLNNNTVESQNVHKIFKLDDCSNRQNLKFSFLIYSCTHDVLL